MTLRQPGFRDIRRIQRRQGPPRDLRRGAGADPGAAFAAGGVHLVACRSIIPRTPGCWSTSSAATPRRSSRAKAVRIAAPDPRRRRRAAGALMLLAGAGVRGGSPGPGAAGSPGLAPARGRRRSRGAPPPCAWPRSPMRRGSAPASTRRWRRGDDDLAQSFLALAEERGVAVSPRAAGGGGGAGRDRPAPGADGCRDRLRQRGGGPAWRAWPGGWRATSSATATCATCGARAGGSPAARPTTRCSSGSPPPGWRSPAPPSCPSARACRSMPAPRRSSSPPAPASCPGRWPRGSPAAPAPRSDREAWPSPTAAAGRLDLAALRQGAKGVLKPGAFREIRSVGEQSARIQARLGARGTLQALAVAENADACAGSPRLSRAWAGAPGRSWLCSAAAPWCWVRPAGDPAGPVARPRLVLRRRPVLPPRRHRPRPADLAPPASRGSRARLADAPA